MTTTLPLSKPQRVPPPRDVPSKQGHAPGREPKKKSKPRQAPLYNLILWNDDFHSFEYVIETLIEVLRLSEQEATDFAIRAHNEGKTVILTAHFEKVEFIKEQIETQPPDPYVSIDSPLTTSIERI